MEIVSRVALVEEVQNQKAKCLCWWFLRRSGRQSKPEIPYDSLTIIVKPKRLDRLGWPGKSKTLYRWPIDLWVSSTWRRSAPAWSGLEGARVPACCIKVWHQGATIFDIFPAFHLVLFCHRAIRLSESCNDLLAGGVAPLNPGRVRREDSRLDLA